MGAEKLLFSKLLVPGSNKRIYNIDTNIGMVDNKIKNMFYYIRLWEEKFLTEEILWIEPDKKQANIKNNLIFL